VFAAIPMIPARAASFLLDDFSDTVIAKQPDSDEQHAKGSKKLKDRVKGVVGGTREVTLSVIDTKSSASTSAGLWIDPTVKSLNYASTVGVKGSLQVLYDADGRGFNAEFANVNGLRVEINASASAVPYQVMLTLTDRGAKSASSSRTVSKVGVQQVEFFFKDIELANSRKLQSILLAITPGAAGDLEIRKIESIDSIAKQ
jgi:hypothetical protein